MFLVNNKCDSIGNMIKNSRALILAGVLKPLHFLTILCYFFCTSCVSTHQFLERHCRVVGDS